MRETVDIRTRDGKHTTLEVPRYGKLARAARRNRATNNLIVTLSEASFVRRYPKHCQRCSGWGSVEYKGSSESDVCPSCTGHCARCGYLFRGITTWERASEGSARCPRCHWRGMSYDGGFIKL
jgi:uncharacterized C2H2 Zn-finger protein